MSLISNFPPISNITPFTYRDGETYLELLNRLRDYVGTLTDELNASLAEDVAGWQAGDVAVTTKLEGELTAFTTAWQSIIEALQVNATTAFDPTTGQLYQGISRVISNVYDNVRVYAYFADQLDNFAYTAAEWDALGYTTRHFDLGLAYSPTQLNDIDTPNPTTPHP